MNPVGPLAYHLRREGASFRARFGIRVILVHVLIVAVFGVALPWMRGIEFLDSVMLAAYACLGVLFAAPAAAQAFAAERPRSLAEAMARIAMAVLYGEMMAFLILLAGFMTVYVSKRVSFPPDLVSLAEAFALGLFGSAALASIAAWITIRFSASAARSALRVMFLLLLVLFFYKSRWLPDVVGIGIVLSIAVTGAALALIRQRLSPAGHESC
jgi:hypothetical protein